MLGYTRRRISRLHIDGTESLTRSALLDWVDRLDPGASVIDLRRLESVVW